MKAGVRHFVGLDLGQARDYSALCNVERVDLATGEVDPATRAPVLDRRFQLRFLERFELGTPYPRVVERAGEVCAKLWVPAELAGHPAAAWLELHRAQRPELVVDATGVGRVVVDLLRVDAAPYALVPVTITAGDRASVVEGFCRVPKRDLVGSLVVMLQRGELAIAESLELAPVLVKELLNFRVTISAAGNDSYGNWREAANDDLVLAVALAAWRARRDLPPVNGARRLV